jgi:hypothetical protein
LLLLPPRLLLLPRLLILPLRLLLLLLSGDGGAGVASWHCA